MDFLTLVLQSYLALVGAGLIALSIGALRTRIMLWRKGARTDGAVVGWTAKHDTDGTIEGWSPRVRFRSLDGVEHELTGLAGWAREKGATGRLVPVIYDPGRPTRALSGGPVQFWIGPPVLFAMGLAVLWAIFR